MVLVHIILRRWLHVLRLLCVLVIGIVCCLSVPERGAAYPTSAIVGLSAGAASSASGQTTEEEEDEEGGDDNDTKRS
jgi:hypothetical protein